VARLRIRERLRAVARTYPAGSRLWQRPETMAEFERLDAALVAAIEAEDLPAVERALGAWERWWGERVAAWRAGAGRPGAPGPRP
jgi:hypothetical protein